MNPFWMKLDHEYNVTNSLIQVSHRTIEEEPGKVKEKHRHQEIIGAFDMIQSFMEDKKLPLE